ncbi:TPA: alanine--glyoxylate aminotransferase family protein [Candidatus Woesearchaeota archaeon]|nr:alanine--glyoxylate aminotransferase family protein [Candidatus Woesearchaeota archaeon]
MKEPVPNPELYLFAPGPHAVEESLLEILSDPVMGHRDAPFVESLKNLVSGLTELLGIEGHAKPFITTGHATDMFSNVAQLLTQETREIDGNNYHRYVGTVLLVNSDPFSNKTKKELERVGVIVHEIKVEYGKVVDLEELARETQKLKPEVVYLTGSNTASGSYQLRDGTRIREAIGSEPLLVVDEVSQMAGVHIPREKLGIDFAFAGTQKAWMLPPGLVVGYATDRALERARTSIGPKIHNLYDLVKNCAEGKPDATDNTSFIRALEQRVYDMLQAGGADAINDRNIELNAKYDEFLQRLTPYGIMSFPTREDASPTVGCFTYNTTRTDMKKVAAEMKSDATLVEGYKGVKIDTGYRDVNEHLQAKGLGSVRIPIFGQEPVIFETILNKMEKLIKKYTKPLAQ